MKGAIYQYPNLPKKLHRYFISYTDRMGRCTEENFDTRKEALHRIREIVKTQKHALEGPELWTRERAIEPKRLRKKPSL